MIKNTLSIAGIDPSGGAGLLADLKAFSALGTYGMGVVCALTAQNTRGVTGVQGVAPDFVAQQLETLLADVKVDAVKVGLLGTAEIAHTVAACLRQHRRPHVIVDPVITAKSGHVLLPAAALDALREEILPQAELITPNLKEAALLLGVPEPRSAAEMRPLAKALLQLGPQAVLLKGGALTGDRSIDWFATADGAVELEAPRVSTKNLHGTGCNLAAAITALRPQRATLLEAVREAKAWLTLALESSGDLNVGGGQGPVHAFHAWWGKKS